MLDYYRGVGERSQNLYVGGVASLRACDYPFPFDWEYGLVTVCSSRYLAFLDLGNVVFVGKVLRKSSLGFGHFQRCSLGYGVCSLCRRGSVPLIIRFVSRGDVGHHHVLVSILLTRRCSRGRGSRFFIRLFAIIPSFRLHRGRTGCQSSCPTC